MILLGLALGKAEGKNADLYVASLYQFFRTGDDGGTSSYHIVDDEQMFALNRGSINELKDFFHVFIALPTPQIGLAPFKANTFDNLLEKG